MRITVDCRAGVHNQDITFADVDVSVARLWLAKLDGNQHTLLNLVRSDGHHVMVGGGPSWYVVTLDDGKNSLTLQNPHGVETEMIELCAGGQYGEYPASFCVDQIYADQVIDLFFDGTEASATWA